MSSVLRDPDAFRARFPQPRRNRLVSRQGRAGGGTGGDGGIRSRLRGRFEGGRQSSYIRGSSGRSHNLRISRAPGPLDAPMRGGGDGGRSAASSRRAFPAGGSARRNAGISRRQRRVYDQCRADREGRSDRRRRLCARDRPVVGRRRHGVRVRSAASARSCLARDRGGAFKLVARPRAWSLLQAVRISMPQSDAFLKGLPIGETRFAGSSLKFCLIAEGLGDVYPRFAPTMEWDTAAGDAVLRAAGGAVLDPSGRAAFVRQRPRADCATALSSPGVTRRPPSNSDIKIIALGFAGHKLNLQRGVVQPVRVNGKPGFLTIC